MGILRFCRYLCLAFWILFGIGMAHAQLIRNQGQWHKEVRYAKEYGSGIFYVDNNGFTILLHDDVAWNRWIEFGHRHGQNEGTIREKPPVLKAHAIKIRFSGSSSLESGVSELEAYSHHYNYFLGNDPAQWASRVPAFRSLIKKDLYPGIDLEIKETELGYKYNLIIHPEGKLEDIRMTFEGADELELSNGKLRIRTSLGWVEERIPASFISGENGLEPADVSYVLDADGTVRFKLSEKKRKRTLIIDPELVFSTYSGSSVDNFGFTATYDEEGNLYAGGIATSAYMEIPALRNGRYPATAGAYQATFGGGEVLPIEGYSLACDISLSKYSPDGKQLLYATYLGGINNEYPHSLVVNQQNELIVFGTTMSINYPVSVSAFQRFYRDSFDMVLTRFSSDGSRLLASTYIGSSGMDGVNEAENLKYFYADNYRGEVNVDENGDIFVASSTTSRDFPVTSQAFQQNFGGGYSDGVIMRFNADLSIMKFSSYLGGSGNDALYSVDVHPMGGDIYVSGGTGSTDLPNSGGTLGTSYFGGISDGFVAVVSGTGRSLVRSMYWGTTRYDQIFSLDIDRAGQIYVIGQSEGSMPVTAGVYHNANSGVFISAFTPELNSLHFSTVIGASRGIPDITINAFMVDECSKIYASGWGGVTSNVPRSNTRGLPLTNDAAFKTTDGSDFYLFVLSRNAEQLLYATYFGGTRTNDHVDGGTSRFDKRGAVYQSVCASCPLSYPQQNRISDFPVTSGAYAETNSSPRCSNASFKFEFGNINFKPVARDTFFKVRVFDTLDFVYTAWDANGDSIDLYFYIPDSILPLFKEGSVRSLWADTARHRFSFIPGCIQASQDTIKIPVLVSDRGCPYREDSMAMLSILVEPAPLMPPPEVVCLQFVDDDQHVLLSWENVYTDKFFERIYLYRVNPDGSTIIVDSADHGRNSSFRDLGVTDPTNNNYRYFLRSKNRCGFLGDSSYLVSTTQEFIAPIKTTRVYTVTVEENKDLRVIWMRSDEEDFASYELFKWNKTKDKFENWEKIDVFENREDTTWLDKWVKVDENSYCYRLRIRDNCGNVSQFSNLGCSMVLTGDEPPFAFNLYWNPYEGWENGIENFQMYSAVDTGSLRPKYLVPGNQVRLRDEQLNYDWGGYWYQVEAYEGSGGYGATSLSNAIYLIQPPLLHVPNAFTPNGDMLNELWGIVPVFVKEYDLKVFDRWGGKVFETQNKHEIWDGTVKGVLTPLSVYVYTITYTGWDRSVHQVKGTVTILK